jgi:hypothetical protein
VNDTLKYLISQVLTTGANDIYYDYKVMEEPGDNSPAKRQVLAHQDAMVQLENFMETAPSE